MAMTFYEWRRRNADSSYAGYEAYLGKLAEAAQRANTPPDGIEITVTSREMPEAGPPVHKAQDDGTGHCTTCGQRVRVVLGGRGPVPVHSDSGAVAAPNPPGENREWNGMEDAYNDGYNAGRAEERALARRQVAQELMDRLREGGCRNYDWNGGDTVEIVDQWLQEQGVDTSVYECASCDAAFGSANELAVHSVQEHGDGEEEN